MRLALTLVLMTVVVPAFAAEDLLDPKLPAYTPVTKDVSGAIKSEGSDTMNNLMTLWTEAFKKIHPKVEVGILGKGSGAAPTALTQGTANFGPMSRDMKAGEIDKFEAKFGYKPTRLPVAIDSIGFYVHPDNPIKGLTFQQLDALFSATRKAGGEKDIKTWGDLGLTGEWADKPIRLYGRNDASGTYQFVKEAVLLGGDYKAEVQAQPGSAAVVQAIANDKFAIGYSGIGYKTDKVRTVPLAKTGESFVDATPENTYKGSYPLARFLVIYINAKPGAELDPLQAEFIRFLFSKDGQAIVQKDGYYPVKAPLAEKVLKSLGL